MNTILRIIEVSKRFGGLLAVDRASVDFYQGDAIGIVGDNGAGKSTLIKMISGVYEPSEGQILFNDKLISGLTPAAIRILVIETIYIELSLSDNLSAYFNIFMGREKTRKLLSLINVLDEKYMEEESKKVLSRLNINIPSLKTDVAFLSGGQRQAVAIGRTIYWNAELLIMDEPTAALGVEESDNVRSIIRKLKEDGVTVIIISHNINEIYDIADRFMVLKNGRIVSVKKKDETCVDAIISMIVSGKEI